MKKIKMLSPFKHFCMTIGHLPSSYIDSMSYYECILWLSDYLKNTVVPVVNNNSEVVDELQEFVTNYFDNLDVQQEINNKLDEMSESGQLQEIISAYLNSKAIFGYDTVADMKQANNLINGSYAKTLGYHTKNDGGSATYKIREITNDDVVDESFIISMTNNLVAELLIEYPINPLCLGAYGDGTHDDYAILQKAIYKGTTKLFSGTYYISQELRLNNHSTFDGNNRHIFPASGNYAFYIDTQNEISLRNLFIDTEKNAGSMGIYIKDSYFIYLDNVNIYKLKGENTYGINIQSGFNIDIKDTRVYGSRETGQIGINLYGTGNVTNIKLDTLLIQQLDKGIKYHFVTPGNTNVISNVGFSSCNECINIKGYADPISMYDLRIEYSDIGVKVEDNVNSSITNMNCWNTDRPIVNLGNTGRQMNLYGALSFTGNTATRKPIFATVSQDINIYGYIYPQANEYELITGETTFNNGTFVKTINKSFREGNVTGTSFTAEATSCRLYKLNQVIDNIYGRKGTECYIYTTTNNVGLRGSSGGSTTCMLANGLDMEVNKIYHVVFMDGNRYTIIQ